MLKKTISEIVLALMVCGLALIPNSGILPVPNAQAAAADEPLLQQGNLTYLGSFRMPANPPAGASTLDYPARGLAYNPANNSLFVVGHSYSNEVSEISIPTPVVSSNLASLPLSTYLQGPSDITEGNFSKIGTGGASCCTNGDNYGGLMVYNGKLYGTIFPYYDYESTVTLSHFVSGLNLSAKGDFKGMYQLQTGLTPGYASGAMTPVPTEWQSILGGKALSGNCCIPITARTSTGPSAFAFNPEDLGSKNPVPASPLLYYTLDHQTLGSWGQAGSYGVNGLLYNGQQAFQGMAFPNGTRSVLYFGATGLSDFCYGPPTTNPALNRAPDPNSSQTLCYDPVGEGTGPHGYPYSPVVYAYDANDMAAVKNGSKKPWEIVPYATWKLSLPFTSGSSGYEMIRGVAYDPASNRIYVSSMLDNYEPYSVKEVIHVFQVNGGTTSPVPVPPPVPAPTPVPVPPPTPQPSPVPAPTPVPTQPANLPKDGTLIKARNNPTIYVMENGQKRPIASWTAFVALGYKLSNVKVVADIDSIPTGPAVANQRHVRGTMILGRDRTVYFLGVDYRYPFPSTEIFNLWKGVFAEVVDANDEDLKLPVGPVVGRP